jgi:hypothetical protein
MAVNDKRLRPGARRMTQPSEDKDVIDARKGSPEASERRLATNQGSPLITSI